jgi:hypothetical protein
MLWRQAIYFLGNRASLSNFLARNFSHLPSGESSKQLITCDNLAGFLTALRSKGRIYLESAAFLLHMTPVT